MDVIIEKKKFNKFRTVIFTAIVLLLIFVTYLFIISGGKSKLNIDTERIIVSVVKDDVFQENIPVSGNVLPITTIYLDALEGGQVEDIFVEDGAIVKKGDPILRLSNTDLELSLINQETSVYNLLTQMRISQNAAKQNTINKLNQMTDVKNAFVEAERLYKLNKALFTQRAVGRQEFQEAQNNYNYQKQRMVLAQQVLQQDSISTKQELQQSRNSYTRIQSALELMSRKVGDLVVKAPVDGQITSFDSEIGQSKNKGERLGQLDVLSGFKVRVDIIEHYITRIYPGQYGTFSLNGETYKLHVKKVYSQVTNGRFQVDMLFEEMAPKDIRRGQTLQIRLKLSDEKQALLIPKGSFFQQTGGNWIFKLSENGKIAQRINIQIGNQNTEYYEVLGGLNPGDKVITSSYENFGDKQELILK